MNSIVGADFADMELRVAALISDQKMKTALHACDVAMYPEMIDKNTQEISFVSTPRDGMTDPDHSINPRDYVLGFAFSENRENVVLIRKNKPAWQAGNLNGVGGKLEYSDNTPFHAMVREWYEETGTACNNWTPLAIAKGVGWNMWVFQAFNDTVYRARTVTDEEIMLVSVPYILGDPKANRLLPSLSFYIPLALEDGNGLVKPVTFDYSM